MKLSTPYVTIHLDKGVITLLENHFLRRAFEWNEALKLYVSDKEILLAQPDQENLEMDRVTVDDFVTGREGGPLSFECSRYQQRWNVEDGWVERHLLLFSNEYNDGNIFVQYSTSFKEGVRLAWESRIEWPSFALNRKRSMEFQTIKDTLTAKANAFQDTRIYIGKEVPAQEVFCYCNYKDETLVVNIDSERRMRIECEISAKERKIPLFLLYQIAGQPYSDTLFLVERGNWRGALAAIAYQKSFNEETIHAPFRRWTYKPFSVFLWYDPGEGIVHYQRLLSELPSLQSIFVFGKINHNDYRLLKHILTEKERLPPRLDPKTGRYQHPSKIFIVYPDDEERSYSRSIVEVLRDEIEHRKTDALIAGVQPYVPRTEPIPLQNDAPQLPQYKSIIESWLYGESRSNRTLFVLPPDPVIAALVSPLARYMGGYVWIDEGGELLGDGRFGGSTLAEFMALKEHPVIYPVLQRHGNSEGTQTLDRLTSLGGAYVEPIFYNDYGDLASQLAIRFIRAKILDYYLMMVESGGQASFRAAFEKSVGEEPTQALETLKEKVLRREVISEVEIEDSCKTLPDDLQSRILIHLAEMGLPELAYYLSPVNEPSLLPHAILSGPHANSFHNLYSACNYASFRLAPVLLLDSPPDSSLAFQLFADLNGLEQQAKRLSSEDYNRQLRDILNKTSRKLVPLLPEATRQALGAISPQFLSLIPGDPMTPYEMMDFGTNPPNGLLAREGSKASGHEGKLSLRYRVGRLTGNTEEMTCRILAHAALTSHVYRGEEIRVVSFGDPRNDLPGAAQESSAFLRFLDLLKEDELKITYSGISGFSCYRKTFVEMCNDSIDFLHFAGHCKSSVLDPFESRLLLADSTMSSFEVANDLVLLRNPVVFLNACESGRGPGHLTTAFFRAFAGAVVGTLWPVFDDQAALLSRVYLKALLSGYSLGTALRLAKAHVAAEFNHAGDVLSWHSYVLYGDPTNVPFLALFPRGRRLLESPEEI